MAYRIWSYISYELCSIFLGFYHRYEMSFALSYLFPAPQKKVKENEVLPCDGSRPKAVIIGGGHAGSKMASKLDSIFDVVLIDRKNFLNNYGHTAIGEYLTSDLIEQSLRKLKNGNEATDEERHINNSCFPLHRFYLKHANVIVGEVEEIHENKVSVKKSRMDSTDGWISSKLNRFRSCLNNNDRSAETFSVPYDILFFAIGEKLAFPFQSSAKFRHERTQELQDMMRFLQADNVQKIAVMGGGPCGVSLTKMLSQHFAESNISKKIHLFASSASLLPSMPRRVQKKAFEDLDAESTVTLSLNRKVVNVTAHNPASFRERLMQTCDALLHRHHKNFGLKYIVEHTGTTDSTSYWMQHRERSLLHHLFFGKAVHQNMKQISLKPASSMGQEEFDYVFDCTGATPRVDTKLLSQKEGNEFFNAAEHLGEDGYFQVNQFFQLHSHPNIFAIGRCVSTSSDNHHTRFHENNHTNVLYDFGQVSCKNHSLSSTDAQVDYVFNHILSIVSSPSNARKSLTELNLRGYPYHNNFFHYWPPQLMIPFGKTNSIGVSSDYPHMHFATPFTTSINVISGNDDHTFLTNERDQHCKNFVHPKFYRQKNAVKISHNFNLWLNNVKNSSFDFH